jgi:predicted ATP-dependent protease
VRFSGGGAGLFNERIAALLRSLSLPDNAVKTDAAAIISLKIAELKKVYLTNEGVLDYLALAERDMAEKFELFTADKAGLWEERYKAAVLVARNGGTVRPVVFERHPSYENLFGFIGRQAGGFADIKVGSLLKADGGCLIVRMDDLLKEKQGYIRLKQALLDGFMEISGAAGCLASPSALQTAPIKITAKLIVIGSETLYETLAARDSDFTGLFKVLAEFTDMIPQSAETTAAIAAFMASVSREEKLLPVTEAGAAEVLKYAAEISGSRDYFTARLAALRSLLIEAGYWAEEAGASGINAEAVKKARAMTRFFNNLGEEFMLQEISKEILMIRVNGCAVGKINALVVIERGNYCFGCPALISAQTAAGKEGIINIEREAGLSGEIHDKGVFILDGFLRGFFGRTVPLSITMSLGFEQSYDNVEGDSATLAETCVLLSSIAQAAIKQEIGVTGSMNQFGEVQAVGGISEKVNGFFSVCKMQGLTGGQGVIIPARNISHLFLDDEVAAAVEKGVFHIWPVDTLQQALYLLTGCNIDERDKKGRYLKESLFGRVEENLKTMNA